MGYEFAPTRRELLQEERDLVDRGSRIPKIYGFKDLQLIASGGQSNVYQAITIREEVGPSNAFSIVEGEGIPDKVFPQSFTL